MAKKRDKDIKAMVPVSGPAAKLAGILKAQSFMMVQEAFALAGHFFVNCFRGCPVVFHYDRSNQALVSAHVFVKYAQKAEEVGLRLFQFLWNYPDKINDIIDRQRFRIVRQEIDQMYPETAQLIQQFVYNRHSPFFWNEIDRNWSQYYGANMHWLTSHQGSLLLTGKLNINYIGKKRVVDVVSDYNYRFPFDLHGSMMHSRVGLSRAGQPLFIASYALPGRILFKQNVQKLQKNVLSINFQFPDLFTYYSEPDPMVVVNGIDALTKRPLLKWQMTLKVDSLTGDLSHIPAHLRGHKKVTNGKR